MAISGEQQGVVEAIPTPPPGYVILPKAVYDLLVAQASGQVLGDPEMTKKRAVQLLVLKPLNLGDIKAQLDPGEKVSWVPRESLTIKGAKHNLLGSFHCIWNKQDPRNQAKYDRDFDPFFEVLNPEVLDSYLGPALAAYDDEDGREDEADRIAREERHGDSARVQIDSPGMPLKGTPQPSRRELIRRAGPDRMMAAARRGTGLEDEEGRSPADFKVTQTTQDHRVVVSQIPGKPADEAIEALAEAGAKSRPRAR